MMDWDALEKMCMTCTACGLCATRHHVVFGVGPRDAGVQFPFGMILQMFAGIFPDLYMLQVVDTFVFDDREYIGRNIGIGLQRVPVFPVLHQRFYSEIFGNSYIPHIYIRKADEPSLIICE